MSSHFSRNSRVRSRDLGFSLVELVIVIAIIIILVSVAIVQIKPMVNNAKADTAVDYVLNQMRLAHERAVDERRVYQLSFTAPGTITLLQGNTGGGGAIAFTALAGFPPLTLPNDMIFQVPNPKAGAAPDGFGTQATAIDFSITGGAGGGTTLFFQPDGTVLDNVGGLTNGVIYMARTKDPTSNRAVTLFGGTGRAKAWKEIQVAGGGVRWAVQ